MVLMFREDDGNDGDIDDDEEEELWLMECSVRGNAMP